MPYKSRRNQQQHQKRDRRHQHGPYRRNKINNTEQPVTVLPTSLAAWTENYTYAVTWQLRNEVAYWKSRAKSLEYENKVLRDNARQNHTGPTSGSSDSETDSENPDEVKFKKQQDSESSDSESNSKSVQEHMEDDNNELELSEEYIAFVRGNAKYREDARREREKLNRKMRERELFEEEQARLAQRPKRTTTEELKKRYGSDYEKIRALESAVKKPYNEECEKTNPMVWPVISFRP